MLKQRLEDAAKIKYLNEIIEKLQEKYENEKIENEKNKETIKKLQS